MPVCDPAPPGDLPVRSYDEDAILQPGTSEPSQIPDLTTADFDDLSPEFIMPKYSQGPTNHNQFINASIFSWSLVCQLICQNSS